MLDSDFRTRYASDIRHEISVVKADLMVKLGREDYHGVRDACVDIETKLAEIRLLEALS